MKRRWRIQRQVVGYLDAQKRWDRTYQLLIEWSQQLNEMQKTSNPETRRDEYDEPSSDLRSGLYPQSGPGADD